MYKSKLQELCHRRLWNSPEYQTSKEGPDHGPRYITNVTVNGIDFQTPSPCRTAKESQNNAAKLALDHYFRPRPPSLPNQPSSSSSSAPQTSNSPSLPQPSPQPSFTQPSFPQTSFSFPQPSAPISTVTGSSSPATGGIVIIGSSSSVTGVEDMIPAKSVLQPQIQDAFQATQIDRPIASVKDNMAVESQKNDPNVQRLYKNQLQYYAQKRNLNLPVYSSEREGPPHASRFKCKVTIDGQTYESPQFFPTLKDAEHAAAKVALMSLSLNVAQEDDVGLYKNLLQELVQKEGLHLPVYSTTRSGEAHIPIFVSNVEIEGELFTGEEAKSKKQGKSNQSSLTLLPAQQGPTPGMSSPGSESNVPTDLQHHVKPRSSISCSHESVAQNPSEKDKDCAAKVGSHHTAIPSSEPIAVAGGRDSFSSEITTGCVDAASSSNFQSPLSLPNSDNLVVDSSGKPSPAVSTSTGRKVTVYSRKTNVEIAQGGTLLPISDENWVVYSYPE